MASAAARRLRLVFLAVGLGTLPGCLTRALWSEGTTHMLVHDEQESHLQVYLGPDPVGGEDLLVEAERLDAHSLPAGSGATTPHGWWRLSSREDGEETAILLSSPDLFAMQRAELEVTRDVAEDEVLDSRADLKLIGSPCLPIIAVAIDMNALPIAALQALQNLPKADFLAAPQSVSLPTMAAECVERLAHLDLAPLDPSGDSRWPTRLVGMAWIDDELQPLAGAQVCAQLGDDFASGGLSLRDRLERLARLRLLISIGVGPLGGERRFFVLRPDAVWLWGGMEAVGAGLFSHVSHWFAEPLGETLEVGSEWLTARLGGTMRLRIRSYRRRVDTGSIFVKILLTPLALAGDAVFLRLLARAGLSLADDDDDEHHHHAERHGAAVGSGSSCHTRPAIRLRHGRSH